jgi:hypothetical protein
VLPVVVACIIVVAVVGLQTDRVGFQAGHPGWVTSMHLSLIKNSGAPNLFLGYVGKSVTADGTYRYLYFSRTPVLFEAISHYLLAPFRDRATRYAYFGHQLMNIVFLATMLMTYKLALLVLENRRRAIFATLMVFAGFYFQYSKDLVEQNRLGALAFALLAYLIALEHKERPHRFFYALVVVACLIGEAAPGLFVLLAWNVTHLLRESIRTRGLPRLTDVVRSRPVKAGCLGLLTVCCALGYNVMAESIITDRPWTKTQIVTSATYRLGHHGDFQTEFAEDLSWPKYAGDQWYRIKFAGVPYVVVSAVIPTKRPLDVMIGALTLISFVFLYLRRNDGWIFAPYLLAVLLYATVMRNLLAFHDFTATYYIGIHVLMFIALAWSLPRRALTPAAVLSLVLFLTCLWTLKSDLDAVGLRVNPLAVEFERIVRELPRDERVHVYFDEGHREFVEGAPFAPAFFVGPHVVALSRRNADFVVSKKPDLRLQRIETDTRSVFLYRNISLLR